MNEAVDLGYKREARLGLVSVFMAGVLWSTVGLGIRLIEEATVWQILLYRSISLSLFLAIVIYLRSKENLFTVIRAAGLPACVAGLALVGAYSGAIYGIQSTSVATAMLLFACAPFIAAILGWLFLREKVRKATWISILFAMLGILVALLSIALWCIELFAWNHIVVHCFGLSCFGLPCIVLFCIALLCLGEVKGVIHHVSFCNAKQSMAKQCAATTSGRA